MVSNSPLLRYGAWNDTGLAITNRKNFRNDEMYPPWNISFRDTEATQMTSMLHCYGFQSPLLRYGA